MPRAPRTIEVMTSAPSDVATLRAGFAPAPGYLDAATSGLPSRAVAHALHRAVDAWQSGDLDMPGTTAAIATSRAAYARLVGVDVADVAIGSQTSAMVALVAASLPDGARVVVVDGDFSSVTYPFMVHADRGVTVRHVPLDDLADAVRPGTDLVAFSLVQSRDGAVADVDAVLAAAHAAGALTLCDVTQAAGWLPLDASRFDLTVCSPYKWLGAPRGTAFLTVRPDLAARLRPLHAGWYAGEDVWASCYGPAMHLAADARRFDVSPAWLAWAGAAPALTAFADADIELVRAHDVGLADAFRAGLDLAPGGTAIVALPDPGSDDDPTTLRARLRAAGCTVAGRAGCVRLAFHAWNDHEDVERALAAVGPRGVGPSAIGLSAIGLSAVGLGAVGLSAVGLSAPGAPTRAGSSRARR